MGGLAAGGAGYASLLVGVLVLALNTGLLLTMWRAAEREHPRAAPALGRAGEMESEI